MNDIQLRLFINKYCKKCPEFWASTLFNVKVCTNSKITKKLKLNYFPSLKTAISYCDKDE